jgi:hypothetical protein
VVKLLAEGKSNKEIGVRLGVTTKTAETHRAHILAKLDLHSMSELVRWAIRNRIIEPLKAAPQDPTTVHGSPWARIRCGRGAADTTQEAQRHREFNGSSVARCALWWRSAPRRPSGTVTTA